MFFNNSFVPKEIIVSQVQSLIPFEFTVEN